LKQRRETKFHTFAITLTLTCILSLSICHYTQKSLMKHGKLSLEDIAASNVPVTTKALAAAWKASPLYDASQTTTTLPDAVALKTPFSRSQYSAAFPRSLHGHFKVG